MDKPILCLDFDGVIHSYTSGWKGADVIPDDPVPGAACFLIEALRDFNVQIYSSRSGQVGGIFAMQVYVRKALEDFLKSEPTLAHELAFFRIGWPTEKPPAMVTIDDRAITFTGEWPTIGTLLAFKPWNKKREGLE